VVLSSLALAAALVCAAMTVQERKRSREQRAAMGEDWSNVFRKLQEQVEALASGAVPDYETAKAAAKAVDDFHAGIANVLNFDPYNALRKGSDAGGDV
jgi:hypothetical protein